MKSSSAQIAEHMKIGKQNPALHLIVMEDI